MLNVPASIARIAAIAALISGFTFAGPLNAATDTSEPPQNTMEQKSPTAAMNSHGHSSQAMAQSVENRIKTLHDKLGVTSEQEAKWGDVAQVMRDNEAVINKLLQARHQDPANMSAVDDLQSYETIAQAHADGLKKVILVFQALYSDMPDDQKKNADKTFSSFEGHQDNISAKKHS
jgi:protein CpxP